MVLGRGTVLLGRGDCVAGEGAVVLGRGLWCWEGGDCGAGGLWFCCTSVAVSQQPAGTIMLLGHCQPLCSPMSESHPVFTGRTELQDSDIT